MDCTRYAKIIFLVAISVIGVSSVGEEKNHATDRRQDNFMFFGGWRPINSQAPFYHGSSSGRFHDILSALPGSLDAASSYYTQSLPNNYQKDIYSYYPRPAIKPSPKPNTPVYMETYRRRKQGNQRQNNFPYRPQPINIQNLQGIDLQQLKAFHKALISAQQLPLSPIKFPFPQGKNVEVIELSFKPLQAAGLNLDDISAAYGKGNTGGYSELQSTAIPAHAVQVDYVPVAQPENKPVGRRGFPKATAFAPTPIHLPLENVLDFKNFQIVELPIPANGQHGPARNNAKKNQNFRARKNPIQFPIPKFQPPKASTSQLETYIPQQQQNQFQISTDMLQQVFKQLKPQHGQPQAQIAAELVTISDAQIKKLLGALQVITKNSGGSFHYTPNLEGNKDKSKELPVMISLPQNDGDHSKETQNTNLFSGGYGMRIRNLNQGNNNYGKNEDTYQVFGVQKDGYETNSQQELNHGQNQGISYQTFNNHVQNIEHDAAGYQLEGQYASSSRYQPQKGYETQQQYHAPQPAVYQVSGQNKGGYQVTGHQVNNYQVGGLKQDGSQEYHDNSYATREQPVSYQQESESQKPRGPNYIEVSNTYVDENGNRREPVLAVELQKGQTIEDAIKALDPETLQKLGAHTKEGLEIEIVELPVDEYSSESQKQVTVVESTNSTSAETTT